jgi:hypothetical protein
VNAEIGREGITARWESARRLRDVPKHLIRVLDLRLVYVLLFDVNIVDEFARLHFFVRPLGRVLPISST